MDMLIAFFVFIFGSIIGSFLNVVILRYNTGRSIVSGRSACFSCDQELSWYNLIPVFSFLCQGGRCGRCRSKISWQYIIVELLTATLFVMTYLKVFAYSLPTTHYLLLTSFYFIIFSLLIIIAVYDFRHKIIPDPFVYLLAALAFARLIYLYASGAPDLARSSFVGGLLMFLFLGSFWFFSDGMWMGLGDAKLILGLGWLNTACYGTTALIYAFWLGAIFGIFINLFFKKVKELPFAPFLIAGFIIVFFFNYNLFSYLGNLACLK